MRYEIRLSGFGGQGIIFASIILAEAVGIYGGKYVAQTQSYGPEARGGKSKAEVVISDSPIDYPKLIEMDILLAMSQDACDSYSVELKSNGILIVDSSLVKEVPWSTAIQAPFTKIAEQKFNNRMIANIVALGSLSYFCEYLPLNSLKNAITNRSPKDMLKVNLDALDAGYNSIKTV